MQVVDAPRFDWRGVMLDVGRHFFPVPFILKLLDVCAFYKINKFHWHLTEDQARPLTHQQHASWLPSSVRFM
jgi:hexosaminidase